METLLAIDSSGDAPNGYSGEFAEAPPCVRCAGLSDVGRTRSMNQDRYFIAKVGPSPRRGSREGDVPLRGPDAQGHIFVVADGMGGHAGGEQASTITVETVRDHLLGAVRRAVAQPGDVAEALSKDLRETFRRADAAVRQGAKVRPELRGMGTTLTVAVSLGADLFVCHVGDSRCYLLHAGKLVQLTRDHTIVAQMVEHGLLAPEEAGSHPYRHVVTSVIGSGERGLRTEVRVIPIAPGDTLLLCSDGLTEMISDAHIASILRREPDPSLACEELVTAANEAGGRDNVTAVVARFP